MDICKLSVFQMQNQWKEHILAVLAGAEIATCKRIRVSR